MNVTKEKWLVGFFLAMSVGTFFAFGLFHLTKFETTDEHLWKYGRIKKYWEGIKERNWEDTYINDKPGVTIALFSGSGLIFEPDPEKHRTANFDKATDTRLKFFDVNKTEFINLIFRLPILIVATLGLLLVFWLALKAFDSIWAALFSVMFLALNPILVGISQIINPDSYLWIFGSLSIFSYLAFLNKKEKKFLLLAGIFMGFSMLSKYTAIILFVFYALLIFSRAIFLQKNSPEDYWEKYKSIFRESLNLGVILVLSLVVFSVFLPAVFVKPAYLTKGMAQFLERGNFTLIFVLGAASLALVVYFRKNTLDVLWKFLSNNKKRILVFVCILFLLVSATLLLNVWTGQKLVPLDQLRDAAYDNEPKKFYFGKEFRDLGFVEKNSKLFLLEAYPFVFSLTPLFFALIIFICLKAVFGKIKESSSVMIFSVVAFSLLYFLMTLLVRVVANVRYSITLQFVFAALLSAAVLELLESLKLKDKKYLPLAALAILILGAGSLWMIRPFYFSYESPLLPKKFTINSSWGHGFYEAAQYLNSKPNAENLFIWSNSSTICPFFKGKCIDSRKIDLNVVKPDYFVVSKRGAVKVKKRFEFINPDFQGKPSEYYFDNIEEKYEWGIFIGDRKENYVKILKFEN